MQETPMRREAITSNETAPPVGPFSQAVRAGEFIFLSGQVGQSPGEEEGSYVRRFFARQSECRRNRHRLCHWRLWPTGAAGNIAEASLPGGHFFVDQFPVETAEILLDFLACARS
jgi:hypothetical protein